MTSSPEPAHVARQARDSIEELNALLLDEGKSLSAPVLSDAVQVLKRLVERLPQAFNGSADVLAMLASRDAIAMDNAAELRKIGTDVE